MDRTAAITVVGAGLIGSTTAFALHRAGYAVTVLDAGLLGAAWQAGAGMLSPDGEGLSRGPLANMARLSLSLWPQFARDLEQSSGLSVHYRAGVERLQKDGLRLCTPAEAQVHPPSVVRAALHGLEVRRESFCPSSLPLSPHSSLTILATGAWSAAFGLPVFPVQGQALLLSAEYNRPALFGWRGAGAKGYTLCRPDGVYVGATVRRSASTAPDDHARRWLGGVACRLLPADVAQAPVSQTLLGLRPCTADDLPIIGPHPTLPGVLVATGHGRHGALLAPYTAREVLRLVNQRCDTDCNKCR